MSLFKTLIGMALDIAQGRKFRFETAEFTGVCIDKNNNIYDKIVPEGIEISHYEITYHVFGRGNRTNWYQFPKGEQPDPAELAGATIAIRYDEDDPFFFTAVGEVRSREESTQNRRPERDFQIRIGF